VTLAGYRSVHGAPATRPSLLLRIRDRQDCRAWAEFVEIYTPLVYRYCRKHGLQDVDAADVAQEVLLGVARSAPQFEYDQRIGSFRGWLLTIVRRRLGEFFSARQRQPQASGNSAVQRILDGEPDKHEEAQWDIDFQRRLFDWAAQRVRNEFEAPTWQAFWQTAVEALPAKAVAERLGMTLGAVYVAKSRVISRLRLCIQEACDE